ncbi:hypothetical protein Fmac_002936 [Flemingia macrophylla]|uniref:RING-type E3 ubiquitin transferase n=1 Tax=Flemingia macrophylla TaxID=520843 RepID=A0ABD1NLH2_9FABA
MKRKTTPPITFSHASTLRVLSCIQTPTNVFAKLKAHHSQTLPPPPPAPHITPSSLIVFSIAVVLFCFVGFSFLFFCRCCFVHIPTSNTLLRLSPNASPYRGLDPSLLEAFPTFLYATVKDLRKEKKYSFECAICLFEFDEDSMLRLLTVCYHLFHQECIDLWLRSHKTCPVCRTDLELRTDEAQKPEEEHDGENNLHAEEEHVDDHVCIDVKDGDADDEGVNGQQQVFARSHSTGHSIAMVREGDEGREGGDGGGDDKYTLRLQEQVALKILKGRHGYSKSCSSCRDMAMLAAPCSNCGYVQTVFDNGIKN